MEVLVGLAIFVLAVNLAYVRFETSEHEAKIRTHALGKLGNDPVPDALMDKDYYKRLLAWTGKNSDEQTRKSITSQLGWRGRIARVLFSKGYDKKVARCFAWISMSVVILGAPAAGDLYTLPIEGGWIWLAWSVLELTVVFSVMLVLAGNRYVSKATSLIDADAKDRDTFISGRASKADTTPSRPGSARRRTAPPYRRDYPPRRDQS